MTLDNIMDLAKGETQDKTYQIGQISEKTGLQKTANGWRKPKTGAGSGAKSEPTDKPEVKSNSEFSKQDKINMLSNYMHKMYKDVPVEKWKETYNAKMSEKEIDERFNEYAEAHSNAVKAYKDQGESKSEPATPKQESMPIARIHKDFTNNFWTRPEDFEQDVKSHGWDVEEMNNEYAVISNDKGSQYEMRFDDHADGGDLTVRTIKPLMIDEDDDDEDIEDAAPLTRDTKIKLSQIKK